MRKAARVLVLRRWPWAAASLVLVAACSSAPEPAEPAAEPAAAGSLPPVEFAEDPLAGAPMAAPEADGAVVSGAPLREVAPPPEPEFDAELVALSNEMALAVLRARFLSEEMGAASEVVIPEGPFTFGELVPIRFRLRNPLGETVELLPPEQGLALVLDWEVERWLPIGGHDRLRRTRWFRLADWVRLDSDETYELRTELPLELDGDPGALWRVQVEARIHCGGALLGESQLPVHRIVYRARSLYAFPPGWQELAAKPLDALRRVLASADRQADRHVLITTALLRGEDRYRGLEDLLDCLERPPSQERALTAVAALQWLTRLPLGDLPEPWIRWRRDSKVAADPR